MDRLTDQKKTIHCFISGSIGVGKTTTLDYLKKRFLGNDSIYFMQEYIDYMPDGEEMLAKSLSGDLDLLDFQKYILNSFKMQLIKLKETVTLPTLVVIWERHPMEALRIFASTLEKASYDVLFGLINDMCIEYDIPNLNGFEITSVLSFDTRMLTPMHVSDCVYNHLLDLIASDESLSMYVFLRCDINAVEQISRIKRRGRECELKEYEDVKKLITINYMYQCLYVILKSQNEDYFSELEKNSN